MLNSSMTRVVLANNWAGTSWNFPRGKINEGESLLECAVRETHEETGYSPRDLCNENDVIVVKEPGSDKTVNMFIAVGVPESTYFEPQTRKEVSEVAFFDINNLPARTWGVAPFLNQLKRWIRKRQSERAAGIISASTTSSMGSAARSSSSALNSSSNMLPAQPLSKKAQKKAAKAAAKAAAKNESLAVAFNNRNSDTFGASMSGAGNAASWGVNDMFEANARLTGRTFDYDGNPHNFGDSHPRYTRFEGAAASIYHDPDNVPRDGNFESLNAASVEFQRSGKIQDPSGKPLKAPVNPDFIPNGQNTGVSIDISGVEIAKKSTKDGKADLRSMKAKSSGNTTTATTSATISSANTGTAAPSDITPMSPSKARAMVEQDREAQRSNEILDFLKLMNVSRFSSASDPAYVSASKCIAKQRRLLKKMKQMGGYLITNDRFKQLIVDDDIHNSMPGSKTALGLERSHSSQGQVTTTTTTSFMDKLEATDPNSKRNNNTVAGTKHDNSISFVLSPSASGLDSDFFLDGKALMADVERTLRAIDLQL